MGGPAALEALQDTHNFSEFDCGEPALNTWLQQRALKNESRYSRTYVVCDDANVVAYVSIFAGSVERADAQKMMRRNAPDNIPVSIIGPLALSPSHDGQGLGRDLLSGTLRRIALASQTMEAPPSSSTPRMTARKASTCPAPSSSKLPRTAISCFCRWKRL